MKFYKLFLWLIAANILLTGCVKKRYSIDLVAFDKSITDEINLLDSADRVFYTQIYDTTDAKPYWYTTPKDFKEKLLALRSFENRAMEHHGISISHFNLDSINKLIVSLDTNRMDYNRLARLDMLLSKSYFDYCRTLKYGYYNPKTLYPKDHFYAVKKPDSTFIQSAFAHKLDNAKALTAHLQEIQPTDSMYKKLQKELSYLYQFKDSVFKKIPALPDKTELKIGERSLVTALLARRMMITHRLPYNAHFDTIRTYTDSINRALNGYRERYNLEKKSALDNATINALNDNFAKLYWKVAVNMERLRWKPQTSISHKYVWVNVATARLRMMRGDSIVGSMDVGVGSEKHSTPLLIGKMYEVVLNPTWTVPSSIIINEISQKSNPVAYIERNNMKVYKNGLQENPNAIEWGKIKKTYQPYTIVQDAGAANSLGRIKFNFGNPFSVYLHDTNAKGVFSQHARAVSHGCVRVQNPLRLAFFCLADYDRNNPEEVKNRAFLEDRIRYTIDMAPKDSTNKQTLVGMGEKAKLSRIALKPGVSVWIDYRTCFVDKFGKLFFTEDYYKMDEVLMLKLSGVK